VAAGRVMPRSRAQSERDLIQHLRLRAPAGTFWTHFPAGCRRSRVTGAILKGMGARAGVPDLLIVRDGRLFVLELKAGRGGLSDTQRETHAEMRAAGAVIGTASGIDEAVDTLVEWGIIR
jgi:hypothetical protein